MTEAENKARADAAAAAKAQAERADALHDEEMKARAERVKTAEEVTAFQGRQRPTPTPDELAAAAVGKNADVKEPSGAVPQDMDDPRGHLDPHKRAAKADGADASYKTREARPAAPSPTKTN